ncbi:MAG: hypothetical protein WDM81_02535 [Rhizomicrobium sp.]
MIKSAAGGIAAATAGVVGVSNSSITTTGGFGLWAEDSGSSIAAQGTTVITSADNAYGLFANGAGAVITSSGDSVYTGVKTNASGQPMRANGTTLATDPSQYVTSGATAAHGAVVQDGGAAWLNVDPAGGLATGGAGLIRTLGINADGLLASGTGSRIVAANETLSIEGSGSAAGAALAGGSIGLGTSAVTIKAANDFGLMAGGDLSRIAATATTINLAATGTTGLLAADGGTVTFDQGTIATTTAGTGQTGLLANPGGILHATDATLTIGLAATTATTMTGVLANGGTVDLANAVVTLGGGASGGADHGLVASAAGRIAMTGGTVSTVARGSFGAQALSGGTITLGGGARITTTGAQVVATATGSHALYALGTGSVIDATAVVVSTSGAVANGARAENGGALDLSDVQITTTGAGSAQSAGAPSFGSHGLYALGAASQITGDDVTVNVSGNFSSGARAEAGGALALTNSTLATAGTSSADTDPTSVVRVMSGGTLDLGASTLTATGQRGSGFSVQDAGSTATVSDTVVSAAGTRANAAFVFNGGQAAVTGSTLSATNNTAVQVQDAGSHIDLTDSAIRGDTPVTAIGYGLKLTGGSATMTGGSATTLGRDSPGLYAANGTITAANVAVTTSGPDDAMGVLADGAARSR